MTVPAFVLSFEPYFVSCENALPSGWLCGVFRLHVFVFFFRGGRGKPLVSEQFMYVFIHLLFSQDQDMCAQTPSHVTHRGRFCAGSSPVF